MEDKAIPSTPRTRYISPERAKKAAAAAVIEAVSSIASKVMKQTSGQPDDPGRTVDEVHAWIRDAKGVGYWQKGPLFFEIYLQKVFWDHTECNTATGLY